MHTCAVLVRHLSLSQVNVTLRSSLEEGKKACPNEIITFNCTISGSRVLYWNSAEYIGNQLEISDTDEIGARLNSSDNQETFAIRINSINGELASTLRINATSENISSTISCSAENVYENKTLHVLGMYLQYWY